MQKTSQRLIELDFFRGLVLLVILVDHIGGSILSRFTLHTYAFNDAAEVFVFLGGFATATAYLSLAERRSEAAAQRRFFKRTWEIYRAFVITAGLMLAVSAVLQTFDVDGPNLTGSDLDSLADAPTQTLADILLFRRQPYLSSVLPMYACFALAAPFIVTLARRNPWLLAAASATVWASAALIATWLPALGDARWNFNPAGWQVPFVLGVLARCQPIHQRVGERSWGWLISAAAVCAAVVLGYAKLAGALDVEAPEFKQNLDWLRIVNFVAIAWLAADLVRAGWIAIVARRLAWIGEIGRNGLLCFIAGGVISLTVDSLLHTATDGMLDVPLGLAADAIAIASLVAVSKLRAPLARATALKTS